MNSISAPSLSTRDQDIISSPNTPPLLSPEINDF
ncbi:hypothetical protein OROGR_005855 [Orobanche gracilis]